MTTAYTSLLGLALPVTGELSGTWGDTVNNSITSLLDSAIAGTTTLSTDADVTLTTTTGASNTSREAILLWTAGGTVTRTITAPAQSKIYTVINASSSTQSIKVVGVGPTTGVTIVKGESALIAWNGSDFVKVSNSGGSFTTQDLTVTGNTILGDAITDTTTLNAQTRFQSRAILGYANMTGPASTSLSTTAPAFLYSGATTYTVSDVSGGTQAFAPVISLGQATIANATTATTYTDAATLYIAGAPSAGTNITLTNPYALYIAAGNVYLGGGTANGVAYLNTSKVLTTGSALVFDGTNLGVGSASLSSASGRVDVTINGTSSSMISFGTGGTRRGYMIHDGTDLTTANEQAAGALRWVTSAGEAMRIATATGGVNAVGIGYSTLTSVGNNGLAVLGNVGIGTSSPSSPLTISKSSATAIEIPSGATYPLNAYGATTGSTQIAIANTGGTSYFGNESSSAGGSFSGTAAYATLLGTGAARSLQFVTSGVVRTTLDSSGNLGLGVTPSANAGVSTLNIANYNRTFSALTLGSNANSAGYVGYNMGNTSTSNNWKYISADTGSALYFAGNEFRFMQFASGSAGATTSGTQAMTFDASGRLLVGLTSTSAYTDGQFSSTGASARPASTLKTIDTPSQSTQFIWNATDSGTRFFQSFVLGSSPTIVGSITSTGSATAYNTSSDYRLKNSVAPMTGALAKVAALKPVTYKWKVDGSDGEGFIAHELAEVVPQCVTGQKDAVDEEGNPQYQGIDVSFLVATLTAAIQELKAEFDAYKASHP
jgi:hypothetical protein